MSSVRLAPTFVLCVSIWASTSGSEVRCRSYGVSDLAFSLKRFVSSKMFDGFALTDSYLPGKLGYVRTIENLMNRMFVNRAD